MIFLLVAAAIVAGAPLVAALLVSVASVHEDSAKSLAGHPPGLLAAAVRRLLQAHVGGSGPRPRPLRSSVRLAGRRRDRTQLRANHASPIPAPRWGADDELADDSPSALAAPRG